MKTTIDIADSVLKEAKKLAARDGVTLREVVETALREALRKRQGDARAFTLRTHVFKGRGLQPGRSWDDWASVREAIYEGRGG